MSNKFGLAIIKYKICMSIKKNIVTLNENRYCCSINMYFGFGYGAF